MTGWEDGEPCRQSRGPSLISSLRASLFGSSGSRSEVLEVLAGLETDGLAGRDRDLDAGLGIAADALLAVAHLEDAEPAELDALALAECVLHGVDDGVDG